MKRADVCPPPIDSILLVVEFLIDFALDAIPIALAKRLGVPKALGLSVDDWVNNRLGGYVKLSIADRREAVKELAEAGESNRSIAATLGVDEITVRRDAERATFVAPADESPAPDLEPDAAPATNVAPPINAVAALAADDRIRATAKATETRRESLAKQKADLYRPVPAELPDGLIVGDFRDHHGAIPDESVELVFTDPPYDRESLCLYEAAAEVAARIRITPSCTGSTLPKRNRKPVARRRPPPHRR